MAQQRSRSTWGGAARLALAGVFLVACAALLLLVLTGRIPNPARGGSAATEGQSGTSAGLQVHATLDDYSWSDLSQISAQMAAAPDDASALAIAASYHLVGSDGTLSGGSKSMTLSDGTQTAAQIVGIRHDDKSDGSGKAGLTFVTTSAIASRQMNANGGIDGGWEASDLRTWLGTDGISLLPTELSGLVVPVDKLTNNAGAARDATAVTATSDKLWLLSAHEVTGDVDWFSKEYGSRFSSWDDVANAEGTQYQLYSAADVSAYSDPSAILAKKFRGAKTIWWYRSAFQFGVEGFESRWFYSAMETGYPYGYQNADAVEGVVVGFCV